MQNLNQIRTARMKRVSSLVWHKVLARALHPCFSNESFLTIWPHLLLQMSLALSSYITLFTGPLTSLHFYSILPLLMRFFLPAWNVFPPQHCLANSYPLFKAQVKCHFPCDAFLYCPILILIPPIELCTSIYYCSHCTEF